MAEKLQKTLKFIRNAFFGTVPNIILTVISVLFTSYYFAAGLYGGFSISILYIWLFFSACIILFLLLKQLHKDKIIRIPRSIIIAAGVVFTICLLFFLTVEACIISGFFPDNNSKQVDYVIVLGARVYKRWPSPALERRIQAAYRYLSDNPDSICIASGGQGQDEIISEAECIRDGLVRRGIGNDRIIIEDRSTSTSENIKYSMAMIGDENPSVAVVSNNFHIFRAKAIARKCGVKNISGIPASMPTMLLPHFLIREFISLVVDTAKGNTSIF